MLLALFRRVASTSTSSSILTSSSSFWKTQSKRNNILRCVGTSLLLLSGNSVIPTTASVEALSITALPTSAAASSNPSKGFSTRLFSSAQEDSDKENSNSSTQQQQGKTGWNHNPPKNPDFYKPQTEVEAIAKALKEAAENNESPKQQQFRTGWLHSNNNSNNAAASKQQANTKPPSSAAGKARRRLEEAMKVQRENHRIVSPAAFHACGKNRQIMVTEHKVSVPLVHPKVEDEKQPDGLLSSSRNSNTGECIDVAFTIVEEVKDSETKDWYENVFASLNPTQRAAAYKKKCKLTSAEDMLLFLQGGPGFGAPTPIVALDFSKDGSSWGSAALDKYSHIVLLDQRGTGKSSPLTKQSLQQRLPNLFALDDDDDDLGVVVLSKKDDSVNPVVDERYQTFEDSLKEATEFLAQFRADNIVRDAEWIRNVLMYTPSVDDDESDDDKKDADVYDPSKPNPWGCVLGQSFGGFCTMTYLSQIQHPPKICLLTGGIAPMLADSAKDVYESLWNKVKERNLKYYDVYPGDVNVVKTIVRTLLQAEEDSGAPILLPSGGRLTARRFLQLGMMLGGSPSSFASLHELLSSAFLQQPWTTSSSKGNLEFSRAFLKAIDHAQPFDEHPIYFWLHESIYADGNQAASKKDIDDNDIIANWSAESVFQTKLVGDNDEERSSSFINEYDYRATSREDNELPVLFFGEMVFPWMSEDYVECGGIGCTALANALASKTDWGPLYDAGNMRAILNSGRSKCAAAIYYEDMYVDFDHSMKVCARGGPFEKCKVYITNEYQHSGLRDDGATIFNKLHGMATGSIRTPS